MNGQIELPIYKFAPTFHYLTASHEKDKYDNGKNIFELVVKTKSTVFPESEELNYLFQSISSENVNHETLIEALEKAIPAISQAKNHMYLPIVFNQIFSIIQESENIEAKQNAFQLLMRIVQQFHEEDRHVLKQYVKFEFNFPKIIQSLLDVILYHLSLSVDEKPNHKFFKISWFIFSLMIKAMVIFLNEEKSKQLPESFHPKIQQIINCIREILILHIDSMANKVRRVSHETSNFFKYLLPIMDK